MDPGVAAGRLLIASPSLGDPNFARTVVLLLDTGADGALGVVLNRPLEVEVADVLDSWASMVTGPDVLFSGGPVETQAAIAVARISAPDEPIGWRRLFDDTGLVDLDAPTEIIGDAVVSMRIFAGYAGWAAGQLEAEIDEGSWLVVPAEEQDAFVQEPDRLWATVLRRQGGEMAMMATLPADPALN